MAWGKIDQCYIEMHQTHDERSQCDDHTTQEDMVGNTGSWGRNSWEMIMESHPELSGISYPPNLSVLV